MVKSAAGEALTASPRQGPAPHTVRFTGSGAGAAYFGGVWLHFGDGSSTLVCPPGLGCRETTVSHKYARAGTYTATLVGVGEGESETLGTVVIHVPGKETK